MQFDDSYSLLTSAKDIGDRLRRELPEFEHLAAAHILYVLSQRELFLRGDRKAALVCLPKIQGVHREWFGWALQQFAKPQLGGADPDFIIYVDTAVWDIVSPDRDLGREALVYHELCHIVQAVDKYGEPAFVENEDGVPLPKLRLKDHDIERFNAEIERYGPVFLGLDQTAQAFVRGHEAHKKRLASGA